VKLRINMTAALAVIALAIAIAEFVGPAGLRNIRISPTVLVIAALLLAARYGVKRQAKKREEILKEVPRHPLGLSDDPEEPAEPRRPAP